MNIYITESTDISLHKNSKKIHHLIITDHRLNEFLDEFLNEFLNEFLYAVVQQCRQFVNIDPMVIPIINAQNIHIIVCNTVISK